MIGRIIWALGLAILAVFAVFAQIDRAARSQASLAAMVPAPFRGFAAERLAQQAVAAEDGAAATRAAKALVRVRPLPAEHMRLMSQAAALDGDAPRALAAMAAATQRGWRDPLAQLAAGRSALLQGEHEAAAQRVSALLAVGAMPGQAGPLLAALLAEPGGRAAFARQLATSARWPGNALPLAVQAVPPRALAQTLAMARAEGAALPCARLGAIATGYRTTGYEQEAALFWPGDCPQP